MYYIRKIFPADKIFPSISRGDIRGVGKKFCRLPIKFQRKPEPWSSVFPSCGGS